MLPEGALIPRKAYYTRRDGVPIYLDRSLRRFDAIYPAAGATNNMFATTPDELLALTGATETDLARDEE